MRTVKKGDLRTIAGQRIAPVQKTALRYLSTSTYRVSSAVRGVSTLSQPVSDFCLGTAEHDLLIAGSSNLGSEEWPEGRVGSNQGGETADLYSLRSSGRWQVPRWNRTEVTLSPDSAEIRRKIQSLLLEYDAVIVRKTSRPSSVKPMETNKEGQPTSTAEKGDRLTSTKGTCVKGAAPEEMPADLDGGASRDRHRAPARTASSVEGTHGRSSTAPASYILNRAPDVQKDRILSWDGLWPPLNDLAIKPKRPSCSSSGFTVTPLVVEVEVPATVRKEAKATRFKVTLLETSLEVFSAPKPRMAWVSNCLTGLRSRADAFEIDKTLIGCRVDSRRNLTLKTKHARPRNSAAVDEPHPRLPRDNEILAALNHDHTCTIELCNDADRRPVDGWQRHNARVSVSDVKGIRKLVTVAGAVKECWVTRESYNAQPISVFRNETNDPMLVRLGQYIYRCELGDRGLVLRGVVARKPLPGDIRPGSSYHLHRCWATSDLESLVDANDLTSRSGTPGRKLLDPVQTQHVASRMTKTAGKATFSLRDIRAAPIGRVARRAVQIAWLPRGPAKLPLVRGASNSFCVSALVKKLNNREGTITVGKRCFRYRSRTDLPGTYRIYRTTSTKA